MYRSSRRNDLEATSDASRKLHRLQPRPSPERRAARRSWEAEIELRSSRGRSHRQAGGSDPMEPASAAPAPRIGLFASKRCLRWRPWTPGPRQYPTRRRGPLPVVIDTNVFVAERWLTSRKIATCWPVRRRRAARTLCARDRGARGCSSCCSPAAEVIVAQHLHAAADLFALGEAATAPAPLEPIGSFDVELRRRLAGVLDAEILPMPTVSHAVLGAPGGTPRGPVQGRWPRVRDCIELVLGPGPARSAGRAVTVITADAKDCG